MKTMGKDSYYLFIFAFVAFVSNVCGKLELTIMHTNDYHGFFDGKHEDGSNCYPGVNENTCYGGIARMAGKVNEIRKKYPEALLLDAGDFLHGSKWYTYLSWKPALKFMSLMKYTAVSMGNHEFDEGPCPLEEYMRHASFPVVCSNIKRKTKDSVLNKMVKKSIIKKINGTKVGIIGFLTQDALFLGNKMEDVEIFNVTESLKREVQILKNDGVNVIIAVGHSGHKKDIEIARSIPEIDIVVGGHSHTFLYNGTPKILSRKKAGTYPTVVPAVGNRKSQGLVVQSYSFGIWLGFLRVQFDDKGDVAKVETDSNPILIDSKIHKDPQVNTLYFKLRRQFTQADSQVIGQTDFFLNGDRGTCRVRECTMGNLVSDSYVEHYRSLNRNVSLAFVISGGIRSSIKEGNVTNGDVISVLPYGDNVETITLSGAHLHKAFEHSVSSHSQKKGRFLQVSGFKITYDLSKPVNQRVREIKAISQDKSAYEIVQNNDKKSYEVVTMSYTAGGGDGYDFSRASRDLSSKHSDSKPVVSYFRTFSPIKNVPCGRIIFV